MSQVSLDSIIHDCNFLAVDNLSKGNFKNCLNLLERAQELLSSSDIIESKIKLTAETLFNLGCYYKAIGKYDKALQLLEQVIDLNPINVLEISQIIDLHLNLCSIYLQNKKFDKTIYHSSTAIKLLENSSSKSENFMALAYYFLGFGYQEMKNPSLAGKNYQAGLQIAHKCFGYSHPTTTMIMKRYLKLLKNAKPLKNQKNSKQNPIIKEKILEKKLESRTKLINDHKICPSDMKKPLKPSSSIMNSRISTSYSKKIPECILPKINLKNRNPVVNSVDFVYTNRVNERTEKKISTPKNPEGKDDFFGSRSASKQAGPQSSRRIKCRRLSADVNNEYSLINTEIKIPKIHQVILIQKHFKGFLARKKFKQLKRTNFFNRDLKYEIFK